ncbi:hypothetical protein FSP39_008022 [Pinctada imbricata]|uniref:Zinc-hook domain-containing protein n=1 Tax=Pinctada imbricata TaxID=66713 RepID=A0AA88YHU9_PINIB|nr:hypothetical protein FSP39_008022 [Pinctada imbricata]
MSCLEKMSVQGIRSFGPEDKDKQVMSFFTPLTLILGPNGTGKTVSILLQTTIIECLKYMTTGIMPPGTKGGAFIHDPKVAHEREVKGQIKLQFRDVTKNKMVIQRLMLVTQKAKKVEMKTLDGLITRIGQDGEKRSISSKCAEMDREMITSLGVAKPVLENVIFCHQEDSNWPLSEGKALKDKFDAIFASTRYVKALDTIRKLKQTQDQELKMFKQDITYLRQHKDKASQLEADLNEVQAKLAASKESVEKVDVKLQPVESFGINFPNNSVLKGSTEELKRTLAEFEDKVEERQETIEQFQRKQAELQREIERLSQEKSKLLMEVGKLEKEAEHHEENIRKRDSRLRKVATKYDFEGFSRGEITDEKYKSFLEHVRSKLEAMVEEGKSIKAEFEVKEKEIQQKIDDVRDKKTKLEQAEKMKKDMMADNTSKIRDINRKLSEVDASAGRLEQISRELKRAEHSLTTTEGAVNVESLKKDIMSLNKEKTTLDSRISELSSEMNCLHLQSSAQAHLDMLKKDKASKEENVRRLKNKQEDTVTYLIGHMPARNMRGELEEYIGNQSNSVKRLSQELQSAKSELSTKEAEKKMVSETLKKKEDDLKELEEKIFGVCGSQNFDEGLSTLQEKMSQAQDQRGSLLGAEHFFKKYVEDLEKQDPCCPLCHREFDTNQEVRELVSELRNKLRMVPNKLLKAEKDLDEYKVKYDSMMQLKPLKENIVTLDEREIPELKGRLKKINETIQKLRDDIQDKDEDLQTKEQDADMAKQILPDIVMMDRYQGEVNELEKKIAGEAAKLIGGDSNRTLQDVINEKEDMQMKLDTVNKQLDHKRQKIHDHSEEVQRLKGKINGLREEKLKIDSDLQQRNKLEDDKANLLSENEIHEREIKDAREQLKPLQTHIDKLRGEKDDIIRKKEEKVEGVKVEVDLFRNEVTKVKNVNQDMKSYNQSGKADVLETNKTRLTEIEQRAESKVEKQKEYAENLDKLRSDLAKNKERERELMDNLRLRKQEEDIKKLGRQIEELEEQLGGIDVKNLDRERKKLMMEQEELKKEKQYAEGRQRGLLEQITGIKRELQSDMYREAAQKYKEKIIMLKTTELASSDLEKYYKALDKAIMNYHNVKMDEINKIVRELWRNTYRGNDIDTIEIRSEDDDAGLTKTRRTYNYRVVMIKGDTALDMRGRCSAGQKVLASLIIRMALAETFCLNCGILALDEPTTNLDRENIESLAYALVDIIKSRSNQKNFQLIVITHDEDFVELLGRSDYVEEFFKVRKDTNGNSRLVRARVEDLHSR